MTASRSLLAAAGLVIAVAFGVVVGSAAASWMQPAPLADAPLFSAAPPLDFNAAPVAFVDVIADGAVDVVARTVWDADPVPTGLRQRAKPMSKASFIVVHHSDFEGQPGPAAILDYHRHEAGFSDIGYHFVVAGDGTVFAGRPVDRVGAHAGISREQRHDKSKDPDDDAIGIVLDGNFETARPSPQQLASAITLIRDLRRRFRLPALHVIGHREVKAAVVEAAGLTFAGNETVCPGEALFSVLPAIRVLSTPQ